MGNKSSVPSKPKQVIKPPIPIPMPIPVQMPVPVKTNTTQPQQPIDKSDAQLSEIQKKLYIDNTNTQNEINQLHTEISELKQMELSQLAYTFVTKQNEKLLQQKQDIQNEHLTNSQLAWNATTNKDTISKWNHIGLLCYGLCFFVLCMGLFFYKPLLTNSSRIAIIVFFLLFLFVVDMIEYLVWYFVSYIQAIAYGYPFNEPFLLLQRYMHFSM